MTDKSADAPLAVDRLFNLTCGHCAAIFLGSYKQAWNQRRAPFGRTLYCKRDCRDSFYSAELKRLARPRRGHPMGHFCLVGSKSARVQAHGGERDVCLEAIASIARASVETTP